MQIVDETTVRAINIILIVPILSSTKPKAKAPIPAIKFMIMVNRKTSKNEKFNNFLYSFKEKKVSFS